MLLNIVFPPGFPRCEKTFQLNQTIGQVVAASVAGTSLSPSSVLVVAETSAGGTPQYLNENTPLKEFNFSQKSTLTLCRKEQVCLVLCTATGARRRLLVDFSVPLEEVVLYLAVKLGVTRFSCLNLRPYGTSEKLRIDRSLHEQGVTPFNRLFCLTVAQDENPVFPADVLGLGFDVKPKQSDDLAANLLNMPEEMLTRATKRGFLNKLNTKKGKFNPRLFVLQDSDLYYYTDAKDKRAKNLLHEAIAAPAAVEEKAPGLAKGTLKKIVAKDRFDFVVSAGDKTIRLSCKTQEEGMAWISAINTANTQTIARAGASASGNNNNKGAIFRNKLSAAVKVADGSEIPEVVTKSIEYLDKQSVLQIVGLFRLSGSAPLIKKLSEEIDAGKAVDFAQIADPHTVTGLLKLYFREMEEPLLTWDLFGAFTASCAVTANCASDRVRYLKQVVALLPPLNRAVLAVLMKFLAKVASYAAFNKMPLHNVATVFAPNILRDKDASLLAAVEASPLVNTCVISLLEYQNYLFGGGPFPVKSEFPPRPYACAHHGFVPANLGDLPLTEGDVLGVLAQGGDGWWYGECAGKYGRFPGSYVSLLEEKEAEKMGKKVKIEVKIQEMREQAEYRDKVLAELRLQRASLQERLSALALTRDLLTRSDFPSRLAALAVGSPQFAATAAQYRDGLAKMLKLTEQGASLEQEALIALNTLWSAANNPKLQKKYKKVLVKLEPSLLTVRAQIQHDVQQKRNSVDVRLDLQKDLEDSLERTKTK